ncbi:hypothetical protein [Flavobacterium collinsii]|uniref:hypothetical protein n=1 Tax=Flavobacterium collinsii TaxID=1114861 RepID=UPI0021E02DD9|nr:hypothetical protein [Flavobacterium collinsii]
MRSLFFESNILWQYFAPPELLPNDRIVFYKHSAFPRLRATPKECYIYKNKISDQKFSPSGAI